MSERVSVAERCCGDTSQGQSGGQRISDEGRKCVVSVRGGLTCRLPGADGGGAGGGSHRGGRARRRRGEPERRQRAEAAAEPSTDPQALIYTGRSGAQARGVTEAVVIVSRSTSHSGTSRTLTRSRRH
ncbi:hypothetical protein JOB18_031143 [Solea senegalensis]|uniref:Uncharacterized protein n=1 Tax=Solea senegalensis TaxID=28829 RepID=A0AAV6QUH2_SOLSE|nr:hypothetical protein JOB18_031143 [Solea senegalensis]